MKIKILNYLEKMNKEQQIRYILSNVICFLLVSDVAGILINKMVVR